MQKKITADFLVYGGTEAGIFAAIQAARSGLKTLLISETVYLFGFFPSLGAWETHYPGCRAPLSREVRDSIINHYRDYYGGNSTHFRECTNLEENNPMITFEPHVAEKVLQDLLEAESNLSVLSPCRLTRTEVNDGLVNEIECDYEGRSIVFKTDIYADCSYTGDLGAYAGAKFSIGRESKSEYNEPHAGRMFTRWRQGRFPQSSLEGKLNVLPTWSTTDPLEASSGEGDDCVQDYSYRICLSNDPDNRLLPPKPTGYDREIFAPLLLTANEKSQLELPFHHRWLTQSIDEMMANDHLFHGHALPGNKRSWNATNFTGAGKDYANADSDKREEIAKQHTNHALGLLYFLQNDEEIPENIRLEARKWGLAKDEFTDTGNLPPEMYIREARRFTGDYVYREQDCLKVEGLERAPIHIDGISFTEFALDSLPCTPERFEDSLPDGQFFEKDKSLPGSLPWRCLMPQGFVNLLTPTSPSVTHCAWGTVRQTASLLHLAEVCACAAKLSISRGLELLELSALDLQVYLVRQGTMISFFNDFDMADPEPWKEAALLFGNRGFFADYDARPDECLDAQVASLWIQGTKAIIEEQAAKPNDLAKIIRKAESRENKDFLEIGAFYRELNLKLSPDSAEAFVTRKRALEILYRKILEKYPQSS